MKRTVKLGRIALSGIMLSVIGMAQIAPRNVPRPPVRERSETSFPRPQAQGVPSERFQGTGANGVAQPQPSAQQGRNVPRPPDEMRRTGPQTGEWLRRNMNLPPEQQKQQLRQDKNFNKLPKDQQERLMQRLDRFNSLTPQQKERWLDRMDWIDRLPQQEKDRVNDMRQQMQQLDPSRRQAIRDALGSMRSMSPEDRRKAIDSDQLKGRFNDRERNLMRGINEMKTRRQEEKRSSGNPSGGGIPPRRK